VQREETVAPQADLIAELQRRLGADSSNSSKPPSSDPPSGQAGAQTLVANAVGAQAGQAAGRVRVVTVADRQPDHTVPLETTAALLFT
jgi:Family of unknown function (DUF6444)